MNRLPALEDIRVFTVCARQLSFKKAADLLEVSPAYISKRIKVLEEQLGCHLFHRAARAVSLTREGRAAVIHAEALLETALAMQGAVNEVAPEGRYRISCSSGFGMTYLNPFVLALREQYPNLSIDLVLIDRAIDIVTEGIDLDIAIGGPLPDNHIARRIGVNTRVLCAAPSYISSHGLPQSPKELEAAHTCIAIRERQHSRVVWELHRGDETVAMEPSGKLVVNHGYVAKEWCLSGEGIMLRSIWNVFQELQQGELVQVMPEWSQPADIFAVYANEARANTGLKLIIESLAMFLQQRLPCQRS
ncbi:LysR substrate-binding domain-containing protein [Neptunomonas sp. XY-337]|uniref:LysR substrate-binding domain-containing protein n=1 Tax=Neptunomonas sp. XY-337 TaxID=2561897 RepID=UPI0010A9A8DC|nr:LysR substrate-binding domain-containing protein [Neptunomonas sp. XY-337]